MAGRKYEGGLDKVYQAMLQRFRRMKLEKPGILASFYLDVFVFGTKQMKAEEVYALNLAPEGTFTKVWREEQKKLGHLTWSTQTDSRERTVHSYKVGAKILKHINDAKMLADEVVTKGQFDKLAERVEKLESAMDKVIDIVDPPSNAAKRQHYADHPDLLSAGLNSHIAGQKAEAVMECIDQPGSKSKRKKYADDPSKLALSVMAN